MLPMFFLKRFMSRSQICMIARSSWQLFDQKCVFYPYMLIYSFSQYCCVSCVITHVNDQYLQHSICRSQKCMIATSSWQVFDQKCVFQPYMLIHSFSQYCCVSCVITHICNDQYLVQFIKINQSDRLRILGIIENNIFTYDKTRSKFKVSLGEYPVISSNRKAQNQTKQRKF